VGGKVQGGGAGKSGLAGDVAPLVLDERISFGDVGGLSSHIDCLKEMVVFPILYPEVFAKFGVAPPKGVLFHGPPGTTPQLHLATFTLFNYKLKFSTRSITLYHYVKCEKNGFFIFIIIGETLGSITE
jgi:hypothetical protein